MELKYLQTLKTILETGSFLNAARKLNYTQSTVTFQMQQLEQELGIKLFEKIGRRMRFTQAGQEILPHINSILENAEYLANYRKTSGALHGSLRVAMSESLLTYRFQPVLAAFRHAAPSVRLSLKALNCYEIRDSVINGSTDIGIHYETGGYGTSLVAEKITEFQLVLAASSRLPTTECDFITPGLHPDACLIINDTASIYQKQFDSYLKNAGIVIPSVLEVGSVETIRRCLQNNLGIAYLPQFVIEDALTDGTLKALPVQIPDNTLPAVCIYHKNKCFTPAMQLFMRLLHEKL